MRSFDAIVMHSYSTLDEHKPGDPTLLLQTIKQMTALLRSKNPAADIRLLATWPRADQIYGPNGAWHGKSAESMARDLRAAYDRAASETPGIKSVIPVGEAWARSIQEGVAAPNPYQGIGPGKLDLWTYDNYHASAYGYYLDALVVFGDLTGLDPRIVGCKRMLPASSLDYRPPRSARSNGSRPEQLQAAEVVLSASPKTSPTPQASRNRRPVRCSARG